MCGICAVIAPPGDRVRDTVLEMVRVTRHRGPDGSGVSVERVSDDRTLVLGHNRLSIVDLSDHAAQPMTSRDGRFVLVYNGEVYNYKEIAQELGDEEFAGGDFGDTAVVMAALRKWGAGAFPRFNGMWALLFYDREQKTLLVSRDRFGVKPLYYHCSGDAIYFASEIKAIIAGSGAQFSINPRVAVPYLTRGLLNFSGETFFEGVHQFQPGAFEIIDLRDLRNYEHRPTRFWLHPFEKGEMPVAGTVTPQEIREVFLDSIRLRLRSDVPVGLLLSGGVDSSSILGGIAALGASSSTTVFSVISDDPRSSEEFFIDRMGAHVGLRPFKVNVSHDARGLLERVPEANWFNDEPICGASDVAYLRLMEAARGMGIKVLLSGQGADEQLGGYNKFFYFWLMSLARDGRYVELLRNVLQSARHSDTLYEFKLSEAIRYLGRRRLASDTFIAAPFQGCDTVDIGLNGSYSRREWIDLTRTSVPALLHYEDRMSMSQSVEVRVPFLDYRLVELLARVHPSEKFEGGRTKSIFRKAIEGLVPPEIQYRRDKKGFNVPEDIWMRHEFREATLAMVASPMISAELGLVDRERLRTLYEQFLHRRGVLNGRHFFRVVIFETFLRRFSASIRRDVPEAA